MVVMDALITFRRSTTALLGMVILLSLFWNVCQSTEDYEIPEVCDGDNPLQYLGVADATDQRRAEYNLGMKLADDGLDVIHVYCLLEHGTTVYAPGQCPADGRVPSGSMPGQHAPLAYAFGRNGTFGQTYVSIRAPVRYYSLGTLSEKVAWRQDGQTLRLAIGEDKRSRECWNASNAHQRTAFIHHRLNQTLTELLRRVNRQSQGLVGTLFPRDYAQNKDWLNSWPFAFGSNYIYRRCDVTFLPPDVSLDNASDLNYTLCSEWQEVDHKMFIHGTSIAIILNCFWGLVFCASFFLSWPWLHGKYYLIFLDSIHQKFPKVEEHSEFRLRTYWFKRGKGVPCSSARNGSFPRELSIRWLLTSRGLRAKLEKILDSNYKWQWQITQRLLDNLVVVNPFYPSVFFVIVFLVLVLYLNAGVNTFFSQPYDSELMVWSPCSSASRSIYVIVCAAVTFAISFFFMITLCRDYRGKKAPKRGIFHYKKRLRKYKNSVRGMWLRFLPSLVLNFTIPVVCMPLGANLIMVCGITFLGALVYHRSVLALIIAGGKLILFDVMKLGCMNSALSPNIAACKNAIDQASMELEASAIAECSDNMWKTARTASSEDMGMQEVRRQHAPTMSVIGKFKTINSYYSELDSDEETTDGTISTQTLQSSLLRKLDACSTRAFLLLCLHHNVVFTRPLHDTSTDGFSSMSPVKTRFKNPVWDTDSSIPSEPEDCIYRTTWALLVEQILTRFLHHISYVIILIVAVSGLLFTLQVIIVHIGELTNTSQWAEFLLPAVVFLQSLYQKYTASQRSMNEPDNFKELVMDAKSLLLLLVTNIGDKVVDKTEGCVHLDPPLHSDSSEADSLS